MLARTVAGTARRAFKDKISWTQNRMYKDTNLSNHLNINRKKVGSNRPNLTIHLEKAWFQAFIPLLAGYFKPICGCGAWPGPKLFANEVQHLIQAAEDGNMVGSTNGLRHYLVAREEDLGGRESGGQAIDVLLDGFLTKSFSDHGKDEVGLLDVVNIDQVG